MKSDIVPMNPPHLPTSVYLRQNRVNPSDTDGLHISMLLWYILYSAYMNLISLYYKAAYTFTFLGFTHYCSHSKSGNFRVKRKTSKKKLAKKCKEVHRLISSIRYWTLRLIIGKLNQILVGYYHYYGITDNFRAIDSFRYRVERSLFYWLNRRSQKVSYTWKAFNDMLKVYPLARPQIYVSIYET